MSREDVQYWLLPIDENNLRCQVAGYRSVKDYLVTNGLKLCKWKETGLIRELTTRDGTKLQFGKYIQYSKLGTFVTREQSRIQPKVNKIHDSEIILRTDRSGINDGRASINTAQRAKSANIPRPSRKIDVLFTQQKSQNYKRTIRESNDPRNINSVHTSNTASTVMEKTSGIKTPRVRPQSARFVSANKSQEHTLRRAKTIYVSASSGLVGAPFLVDINANKSECPTQIKVVLSPKNRPSDFTQFSHPKSHTDVNKHLQNVSALSLTSGPHVKNCFLIKQEGMLLMNSLNSYSKDTEQEGATTESKSYAVKDIKYDILNPDEICMQSKIIENNNSKHMEQMDCCTTPVEIKSKDVIMLSGATNTTVCNELIESPTPIECTQANIVSSDGESMTVAGEDNLETIVLHGNLCDNSSGDLVEKEMKETDNWQKIQENGERIQEKLIPFTVEDEEKGVVDVFLANHELSTASRYGNGDIKECHGNVLIEDIITNGTDFSKNLETSSEVIHYETETTIEADDNLPTQKKSSSCSIPLCSTPRKVSNTSINSSAYVTPSCSDSDLFP